jgi:hypothetical protein
MKGYVLCAFLSVSYCLHAQNRDFFSFPIPEIGLQNQGLIGNIGNRFLLLNTENRSRIALSIFDTSTRQLTKLSCPFPQTNATWVLLAQSVVFAGIENDSKGTSCHFLEVDKDGNTLRNHSIHLELTISPVHILTSNNKQRLLFFQFQKKSNDSLLLKGYLVDVSGVIQKQLAYPIKYDDDLDAEPELLLDNSGNVHVMVFDKFTNYRMSTDLTIHTIAFTDELVESEVFTFEKVKFKNLQIFQNTEYHCLQVEGLYVDGLYKNNKGIFSIAFPLGRKNQLFPRFIPFTKSMYRNFRQGFSVTEETVINSIQLQDIYYADSGSFFVLKINAGIPQKATKNNGRTNLLSNNQNILLNTPRISDQQLALINPNAVNASSSSRTASRVASIPQDRFVNAPLVETGPSANLSPDSSRSYGRNAPKIIFLKLEKELGFDWFTTRTLDVFTSDFSLYNRLFHHSGSSTEIAAALYMVDAQEQPVPVWLTIRSGKISTQKFPEKKVLFSPFVYMQNNAYASIYLNLESGQGGLMVTVAKENHQ